MTMGLLDSILGSVLGSGQNHDSRQAALINAVLQMIANKSGGMGGLAGLVRSLTQAGLGHVAGSWVGTGQNLPVSAEQLQIALGGAGGGGMLAQLDQADGMYSNDTSWQQANIL